MVRRSSSKLKEDTHWSCLGHILETTAMVRFLDGPGNIPIRVEEARLGSWPTPVRATDGQPYQNSVEEGTGEGREWIKGD